MRSRDPPARELGGPALLAIPADLQGTRYLYLGQVGWATLLAALAGAIGRRSAPRRGLALAGVFTLVVINAAAVARHVQPWVEAGRLRDRVLTAAAGTSAMADCGEVTLEGLPDSIRGAYIFRNGAPEAFSRTMGIRITDTPPRVGCRFRWNAQNETFIQVTAPNH